MAHNNEFASKIRRGSDALLPFFCGKMWRIGGEKCGKMWEDALEKCGKMCGLELILLIFRWKVCIFVAKYRHYEFAEKKNRHFFG